MINIEKQQGLLLAAGEKLKEKVVAYAVGGTAMMFLGLKDATADIDLVFMNLKDRELFKEAIKSIGYKEMDSKIVYGGKENRPQMLTLGDERFDLFVEEVIYFIFSESMREGAVQTHQFGNNLIIKIADPHDIILMKCATDRIKDIDDAMSIIKNTKINWETIVEEAKNQDRLGKQRAIFELGYFFEKLNNQSKNIIPKPTTDELWKLLQKQIKERQKQEKGIKLKKKLKP
jgi:hypothetical protein